MNWSTPRTPASELILDVEAIEGATLITTSLV